MRFYFFPSDTFLSATLLCLLLLQDTVATFSFSSPMAPHSSGSSPWTLGRWTLSYHPSLNTHQVNVLGALLEVAREWGCLTMVVSPITTPEQCCSKQAGKIDLVQREVQKLALWILRHIVPLKLSFCLPLWLSAWDRRPIQPSLKLPKKVKYFLKHITAER